jgi:antitoxin component of RelBE/YafQ-DinJ toxin-antitoxin module
LVLTILGVNFGANLLTNTLLSMAGIIRLLANNFAKEGLLPFHAFVKKS